MIDPDTIPLSRFTGPLCYRVKLKAMGQAEYAAWRKWLHAYLTTLGPDMALYDHPGSIGSGISVKCQPPRERRMLLAWLVGQAAVESVDVTPGGASDRLCIEMSVSVERSPTQDTP